MEFWWETNKGNLGKSLGAALQALGKPRPSLIFYLDWVKIKVNPEEQPCQPKENPVQPNSFTWIYILFKIRNFGDNSDFLMFEEA